MHDAFLAIGQYGNQDVWDWLGQLVLLMCKDAFTWNYMELHAASFSILYLGAIGIRTATLCQKLDHTVSAFSELCKVCKMCARCWTTISVCKMLDHRSATTSFLLSYRRPHFFVRCPQGASIGYVGRNGMCVSDHSLVTINQCALRY